MSYIYINYGQLLIIFHTFVFDLNVETNKRRKKIVKCSFENVII